MRSTGRLKAISKCDFCAFILYINEMLKESTIYPKRNKLSMVKLAFNVNTQKAEVGVSLGV